MNSQQLHYNTKFENFCEIPVRLVILLIKKLNIFHLFQKYAEDCRTKKGTYSLASLLMVALQMLFFRRTSKNDFYQNRKQGRLKSYQNLAFLAQIKKDYFPHSKTIDDVFWRLNPSNLEPILFDIFKKLRSSKLFYNHPSLKKTVLTISPLMVL
jgi:hypothetical protein